VVSNTAFAVKAHSTLSMPKATPNRCAICTTTALSAPCCNNNKAVCTQIRVTAR